MKTLRVLLMCLMVLALPLQGFAAVSKVLCHQDLSPSAVQRSEQVQHHGQLALMQGQDEQTQHPTPVLEKHECSNCAQCCVATSMMGTSPVQYVFAPATPVKVEGMRVLQGEVILRSIERPPQAFVI